MKRETKRERERVKGGRERERERYIRLQMVAEKRTGKKEAVESEGER